VRGRAELLLDAQQIITCHGHLLLLLVLLTCAYADAAAAAPDISLSAVWSRELHLQISDPSPLVLTVHHACGMHVAKACVSNFQKGHGYSCLSWCVV
jgi:hypothetical protein